MIELALTYHGKEKGRINEDGSISYERITVPASILKVTDDLTITNTKAIAFPEFKVSPGRIDGMRLIVDSCPRRVYNISISEVYPCPGDTLTIDRGALTIIPEPDN